MQFRSHATGGVTIHLPSGHAAHITKEWRELPEMFHEDAVRAGCERTDTPALPKRPARQVPKAPATEQDHYRIAIATMLAREVDGDFTRDSLPNINAVSELCGFKAVKEDVLTVFREMKAEAGVAKDA